MRYLRALDHLTHWRNLDQPMAEENAAAGGMRSPNLIGKGLHSDYLARVEVHDVLVVRLNPILPERGINIPYCPRRGTMVGRCDEQAPGFGFVPR